MYSGGRTQTYTTTKKVFSSSSGRPGVNKTETRTITIGPDGSRTEEVNSFANGDSNNTDGDRWANSRPVKPSPVAPKQASQAYAPYMPNKRRDPTQNYEEIKADCLRQGSLFEDDEFLAVDSTIFYSRKPPRPFEWKRPHEITGDPQLFVGGASRFDVKQGELGDCWLLAAVASLSIHQDLLYRVVPPDQSFTDDYAGIFHFQFWQYGVWTDVVVDDRLPTYNNRLVFMHSDENNEFWSALLEKAYAKICGSYEALKGGSTSEAMEDFTGGIVEMFELQKAPQNLFQIMTKAHERQSLMGCSLNANPNELEAKGPMGLIMGHAYSVTNVKLVDIKTSRMQGKIPLIRVRNPWGNEAEWEGAWSDKSKEWSFIPDHEKEAMGLTFDDDGEFWMSLQDFQKYFQKLEICNLGPDSLGEEEVGSSTKKRWEMNNEPGAWKRRVSAGGCRNFLGSFWTNPQFRVSVTDPDDDDDDDLCTVVVGLLQKERRKKRKEGLDLLTVGYAVYKLKDDNSGPLDENFFKYNASFAKSPSFVNMREVCGRHKLPPGSYAIVPSTFQPNEEGEFLVRIITEKANTSGSIDEETSMSDDIQPQAEHTTEDVTEDTSLRESFEKIAGEDMEIDAYELKDILNTAFSREEEFKFDGFSIETSRSMVAMMDFDHSGKLGFDEFSEMWNNLRMWKTVFKKFDKDNSGTFSSHELRQALHSTGFRVSNRTFNALVMRFADKNGQIDFDDFILCSVRLKSMFETFKHYSKGGRKAEFGLDDFIQTAMYS